MTFRLIAGPCVIENRDLVLQIAEQVSELCRSLGIDYVLRPASTRPTAAPANPSGSSFLGDDLNDVAVRSLKGLFVAPQCIQQPSQPCRLGVVHALMLMGHFDSAARAY
jgi:hypothetical protein